ncbi:hypothetical protein C5749_01755 [Sphingobacterium gobiense]|uniref:Uncharacterized protein n=1 Tax=Sphingobacterium gobiense TaxID=1382456 RepID=A0A2S9JS14_9SPHI|nr:hypothetical protein C5749_01755 [Sphingobacterium gobiense]
MRAGKTYTPSGTDLQLIRKNADYTVFYDGFTVRFASPHSREKNRPKNFIEKQYFRFTGNLFARK